MDGTISDQETSILNYLSSKGISYERFEHAPLATMEEARARPGVHGMMSKNLFLKSRGPQKFYLLVTTHEARVDLAQLQDMLGVKKLSFASSEEMMSLLGVLPGSVTLLALGNDTKNHVTLILDTQLWNAKETQHHPLVNTSTVVLTQKGLKDFLRQVKKAPTVIVTPIRTDSPEPLAAEG